MRTVSDIINMFGGNAAMARILGKGASSVSEMKRRGRIPVEYWQDIVKAAKDHGHEELTYELLVQVNLSPAKRIAEGAE